MSDFTIFFVSGSVAMCLVKKSNNSHTSPTPPQPTKNSYGALVPLRISSAMRQTDVILTRRRPREDRPIRARADRAWTSPLAGPFAAHFTTASGRETRGSAARRGGRRQESA
jgi:hypothetical protein